MCDVISKNSSLYNVELKEHRDKYFMSWTHLKNLDLISKRVKISQTNQLFIFNIWAIQSYSISFIFLLLKLVSFNTIKSML